MCHDKMKSTHHESTLSRRTRQMSHLSIICITPARPTAQSAKGAMIAPGATTFVSLQYILWDLLQQGLPAIIVSPLRHASRGRRCRNSSGTLQNLFHTSGRPCHTLALGFRTYGRLLAWRYLCISSGHSFSFLFQLTPQSSDCSLRPAGLALDFVRKLFLCLTGLRGSSNRLRVFQSQRRRCHGHLCVPRLQHPKAWYVNLGLSRLCLHTRH